MKIQHSLTGVILIVTKVLRGGYITVVESITDKTPTYIKVGETIKVSKKLIGLTYSILNEEQK